MNPLNITVYLQALGGKLLGPNAYNPNYNSITVLINLDGTLIDLNYDAGSSTDDGNFTPLVSGSTPYLLPILTPNGSNGGQVDYLAADSNTVSATPYTTAPIVIESITPATIIATIPYPDSKPLTITQNILLIPTQSSYTFTLIVPGLLLEQNTATPPPNGISVLVKMMCGCQVSVNTYKSYWSPEDFDVTAYIAYSDGSIVTYAMTIDTSSNDSSFIATIDDLSYTQIYYTAQQRSTGNYGSLNVSA
ncbi:hypothetical protein [Chitinophaga sp.]|uniref:hypothetical protein n=1 Tax=Chitinophaga sp. TaxID=1869181 RepID=UPI002F949702